MFEYRPNIGMGTLICSHYYLLMLTAFVHKFGPSLIRLWKHNSDREDRTQTTNDDGGGQQTGTGTKASSSCHDVIRHYRTGANLIRHPAAGTDRPSCIFRLRFDDRGPNQKPIVCMPGSLSGKSLLQQQIWKGEQRVCPL